MKIVRELEPKEVFSIFDEITKIPRPSKKEEKIIEYLKKFAQNHNLEVREDIKGNIVICKQATQGYESRGGVVLQSHMDMVCEKEPTSTHNFETDALETRVEDGWIRANETTLGADCGIGMALQLAALASSEISHPALEALFTVDEEQGLTGAFELGSDMLKHKVMINLDSEDEGEIFIGCAGGVDTLAQYDLKQESINSSDYKCFRVGVGGLKGGHSGDDIEKGRANANKLIARLLWMLCGEFGARIVSIDGGNLRNAIAREAVAEIVIPVLNAEAASAALDKLGREIEDEFSVTESGMRLSLKSSGNGAVEVICSDLQSRLLRALLAVDNGVVEMSSSMKGLVETSTNLASVKFKDTVIEVVTSQRSSIESAKQSIALSVESVFALSGAKVVHSDGYPGWKPNPDSELVSRSARIYKELFGIEPEVKAIHAGLECGLLMAKYPGMDVISIGPTIRDAHSPSERLKIDSVGNYWIYLQALLRSC